MGVYTRIIDSNERVLQIKTGEDWLRTYKLGDTLKKRDQMPDGVYVGIYEEGQPFEHALVIIHSRKILGIVPLSDSELPLARAIDWVYRAFRWQTKEGTNGHDNG